MKDDEKLIGLKRMSNELDNIRRENFLLTSTVLKCNEEIKSLLNKQQLMTQTIQELQTEMRKLEKKNCDLEEKLQLNIKEIRLMYDDFDKLKRNFTKLNTKLANVDSMASNESQSSSITIKTDADSTSSYNNSSSTSASSAFSTSLSSNKNVDKFSSIYQRMEQLEQQITNLAEQNNDVYFQMNSHFKQVRLNEDINDKVEQKLQYMNDLSQLLRYRLYMMDNKLNESKSHNQNDNANQNRFLQASTGFGANFSLINRNQIVPTMEQSSSNHSISGLDLLARSSMNNTTNTDLIQTKLNPNNKAKIMNHRSISVSTIPSNSNHNNNPVINSNAIPSSSTTTGSRRCHHRIKLFPNRRRRC